MIRTFPIHTPRLCLRRFEVSDAPEAYDRWMSDSDVTEFLTWDPHGSPEESERVILAWVQAYALGTLDWCISLRQDHAPVGSITAVQDFPGRGYCELGYCIAKDMWGKGYMTEAVRAVTGFIFQDARYDWVQARCDAENHGSRRCLEKSGYTHAAEVWLPSPKGRREVRLYHVMRVCRGDMPRM
ncbi:MAG: GNAT family N-acetyltransferase [Methanomassiliicoccaceae archaeon]|nr:GNAT family N-acetyltransferase [Methanomassiliicoccaceae archaeon]